MRHGSKKACFVASRALHEAEITNLLHIIGKGEDALRGLQGRINELEDEVTKLLEAKEYKDWN